MKPPPRLVGPDESLVTARDSRHIVDPAVYPRNETSHDLRALLPDAAPSRPGGVLLAALLCAVVACEPPAEPRVGGARLATADATRPAPAEGPLLELLLGAPPPSPPLPSGDVRIAADRDVPWAQVKALVRALESAGARPYLLVAHRRAVQALPPLDPTASERLQLDAHTDGKVCVSLPGDPESTCYGRRGSTHVDRAFVRELVRKASQQTGLRHVHAVIAPELSWGDAVRTLDGARTCCPSWPMTVSAE